MKMKPADISPGKAFRPMEPVVIEKPFDDSTFYFEPKWDGIRCLAHVCTQHGSKNVQLFTRRLNARDTQYPEVVEALSELHGKLKREVIFDGELIVLDPSRRLSFQLVMKRDRTA